MADRALLRASSAILLFFFEHLHSHHISTSTWRELPKVKSTVSAILDTRLESDLQRHEDFIHEWNRTAYGEASYTSKSALLSKSRRFIRKSSSGGMKRRRFSSETSSASGNKLKTDVGVEMLRIELMRS
ncbi:hypothetical protein E2P81_ATG09857 [Venturia nashicola]|uniref:Uncharacterized protein n=1 Tax=Venturia nashicola TaxID=86259 RepID=A0A4Z1NBM0_9PEZI|nr:hypothetical protein E6O75_ATG02925 [Venturia nashicola]TLD11965.1 hypothetical protein E2P81_ATG09857 [Venturia nashicola]